MMSSRTEKDPTVRWPAQPLLPKLTAETMINLAALPESGAVRRVIDEITEDDKLHDIPPTEMSVVLSADELLERLLRWNGIIGYSHLIMAWIEEIQEAQK